MKQLMNNIKQISILLLVLSFVGCGNDDDSNLPQIEAGFTYTINLNTGTVTFINISESSNSYEWSFGDENSSNEVNPINTYPASGTYTVILTAENVAGAIDTFESEITFTLTEKLIIPITFDNANVDYAAATFEGTTFDVVDNPAPGGTNNVASKVGAITNSGASFEGIAFELGTAIDLETLGSIKMNFWSDAPIDVLMKLEEGSSSTPDVIVSHGGTGWEELSFDFASTSEYSKLVIFVDGPGDTAGTFYMDDVMQIETPAPLCVEDTAQSLNAADFNLTFLSDPTFIEDNATFFTVNNPSSDATSANESCKVGMVTNSNVEAWDNIQIDFADKLTLTDGSTFTMKVYSPQSGYKVTLKLEDQSAPGGINSEVASTTATTKTNEWEELTIPFDAVDSGKFDKITMFFDLETKNGNTYYFDDFKLNLGSGGSGGDCTPDATQSLLANDLNLTLATDPGTMANRLDAVGQFFQDNTTYEYVDNPDFSEATNNSCKVGKATNLGVEAWDNIQIDFADKLTLTDGSNFTIKVFSPQSGYKVTFKLEDKTNGDTNSGNKPSTAVTTKTNEWEELTIPVSAADSGKYDKLVIFFDLETKNTNTYYFDDIKLNLGTGGGGGSTGGSTGGCTGALVRATGFPVNFEACETFMATDGSVKFGDAISAELVENPSSSGINTSAYVLKVDKPVGANHWEGVQNGFPTDFDSSLTFKVKIYTTKANSRFVFEISNDPNDNGVGNPAGIPMVVANANVWTEVEVTFPNVPAGGHNNFVIKPDDDGSGTVSVGAIHYFDDIRLE